MIKLTDGRLSLLNLLANNPNGYHMTAIPDKLFPRQTMTGWSAQGAARWIGRYVEPMVAEGLVRIRHGTEAGQKDLLITPKGLEALGR